MKKDVQFKADIPQRYTMTSTIATEALLRQLVSL